MVGPNGVLEKDVNLDVALRLSIMLELAGGTVVLTRKTDSAVTPEARQSHAPGGRGGVFDHHPSK